MTGVFALVGAMAAVLAGVGVWAYRTGYQEAERKFAAERLEVQKAVVRSMERRFVVEQSLREKSDAQTKSYAARVSRLVAERDRLVAGLRNRPERPSRPDVPESSAAGEAPQSCAGDRLYRSDAEFLVREAARADLIRAALERCQAQYDEVRRAINGEHQD